MSTLSITSSGLLARLAIPPRTDVLRLSSPISARNDASLRQRLAVFANHCWPSRVRTVVGQALLSPFGFLLAYQDDASRALQKVTKVTHFEDHPFSTNLSKSSSRSYALNLPSSIPSL